MAGNKNSGRKNKKFEFEVNRLKELSLKRAIKTLEQKEIDDDKQNRVLQNEKHDITLKVIEKTLAQEVKVSGEIEHTHEHDHFYKLSEGELEREKETVFKRLESQSRASRN